MESRQLTLVTKCLWEFQEMTPEVEGLMLVGSDGVILASTLIPSPSTSRVAAVTAALVGLAKQAARAWARGEFGEVRVRYRDPAGAARDAQLISVRDHVILVVVLQATAPLSLASITVPFNTRQALTYLARVLEAPDEPPPPVTWM